MNEIDFDAAFKALTGNAPLPWQQELYGRFVSEREDNIPAAATLPTGLGKTMVIAVWLLALATNPARVPRRLVYVVNRRTVVDQSTREAEKLRDRLMKTGRPAILDPVAQTLTDLAAAAADEPLAISTLRGQFADNRAWSRDPARPAVIVGTVDMIGSRLLFSGYGCGFKTRPLHAGFLGQDVLLVHDEAHLEPAFQALVTAVAAEQERCREFRPFRVMELTATSRGGGDVFTLTAKDRQHETVKQRIGAKKQIVLHSLENEKKLAEQLADLALKHQDSGRAILVFARRVEDVKTIVERLKKQKQAVQQLTGTLRGLERDRMADPRRADACPIFARFLPPPRPDAPTDEPWKVEPRPGTVYLVCTSAGEVGVNISADHLVCDLSTFESMAQRFGRVNRFGGTEAQIDVVHPTKFGDDELEVRRVRTLELLRLLAGDASPAALAALRERALREAAGPPTSAADPCRALREYLEANPGADPLVAAFAPPPTVLPTSDILFDAWALTTVGDLPGRPPVAEYLHGVEDETQRETFVAWRAEVAWFRDRVSAEQIGEVLDTFPLRPHELLRDATHRVQQELTTLAEGREELPVWLVAPDDTVRVLTLGELTRKDEKKRSVENLAGRTVVLPPAAGGLTATGTFLGSEAHDSQRPYDVAGLVSGPSAGPFVRLRVTPGEEGRRYDLLAPIADPPSGLPFRLDGRPERERLREVFSAVPMRVAYRLELSGDEGAEEAEEYLVLKPESREKVYRHEAAWPDLDRHGEGVRGHAAAFCVKLGLSPAISRAVELAAGWHDLGKGRRVWQRGAGNRPGFRPVAKSLQGRPPENLNHFRHELGSVVDVCGDPRLASELAAQEEWARDLTLHLIAAHHGRGRPHFPAAEAFDPERPAEAFTSVVADTPGRFARLQRRFGRWGLAYLESLVRAADALDSQRIEATPLGDGEAGEWPMMPAGFVWPARSGLPRPTIRVNVDPTNPGQFFACCGLLELADRLWPGAEGWFENERLFCIACAGNLSELLQRLSAATVSSSLTDQELNRLGTLQSLDKRKRTPDIEAEMDDLRTRWRLERLHLSEPFDLWLDWWRDSTGERTDLKTWAAKVQVLGMVRELHGLIKSIRWDSLSLPDCLTQSVRAEVLPFYFDSHAGAHGSALDAGFSTYDLRTVIKGHSPKRPLVELGSFIAFQRFRPYRVRGTDRYRFSTWATPLPVSVAGVVAVAAVEVPGTRWYEFRLFSRTQYMKTFLPATPIGGVR